MLGLKSSLAWLSDKIEERAARRRARMGMKGTAYSRVGLSDDYDDDEELGIGGIIKASGPHRAAYGSQSYSRTSKSNADDTFGAGAGDVPHTITL